MGWALPSAEGSVQIALGCQQLGQQDAAAGRTPQGVVAHAGKLVVKEGVLPQAADADGHAVLGVAVQLGLGAVVLLKIVEELLGRAGQLQLLGGAAELLPRREDLLFGGLLFKADKDGGGVAVRYGDPEALSRDDGPLGVYDPVALDAAPQLEGLLLALLLLAADVGDHVVDDLGHPVKGFARVRNGLI